MTSTTAHSQPQSQIQELANAVAAEGFHPVVQDALVAMQDDAGEWWPQGMPLERVDVLRGKLDATARDGTLPRALAHLERCAVSVAKKSGAKCVATHLVLLVDAYRQEHAARAREGRVGGDDQERRRRAQRLLGR